MSTEPAKSTTKYDTTTVYAIFPRYLNEHGVENV